MTVENYQRVYYERNRERIREQQRIYREQNRDKVRAIDRSYRERYASNFIASGGVPPPRPRPPRPPRRRSNPEQWAEQWAAQAGRCYLCEDPISTETSITAMDHDHRCCPAGRSCRKCRRGLTCKQCNLLIGLARDDPDRLVRIAANLRVKRREVSQRLPAVQLALF
jgi:hypothetical protein